MTTQLSPKNTGIIYAVGYRRVSGEEQAREGISLELQTTKIEDYCRLHDLQLVEIVEDAGISAKDILHRPGFRKILAMAASKQVNAVVIYKLDRAFRNTIEALETAQKLDKAGVAFHSITEMLDTKSAFGRFSFTLMASLAEMERRVISERTSAALDLRRKQGKRISRYAPLGSKFTDDGSIVDDDLARVRIIKTKMLSQEGRNLREIAATLAQMGYVNPDTGKPYSLDSISKMVRW